MCDYGYNTIVVFCFLRKGDDVLLIRRRQEPNNNQETIVGGRKEKGESVSAACKREVLEETGLRLTTVHLRGVLSICRQGSETETLAFYFESDQFEGTLTESREGTLRWCPIDESFKSQDISAFYSCLAPLVFENEDLFTGMIKLDYNGAICDVEID